MPDTTLAQGSNWTKVAFGDVVQLSRERSGDPEADGHERFVGLEHIEPGDLRLRRWGNVADGVTFTSVFRPGQVLFGKRRAYQRKVALADFSGVCSGDIYVLETKGNAMLPELLPFICQTEAFFAHAVGTSAGSLSPRTNWESLASFEFALPPIDEQRRLSVLLAAVDRTCDGLIAAADVARRALNALSFAIFSSLCASRNVVKQPLEALVAEGVRNGLFRKSEDFGAGTLFINVTDIYRGFEVLPGSLQRAGTSPEEVRAFSALPGDVIFNRSSLVLEGIGHACLVPTADEDMVFDCHLIRVRPDQSRILGAFLTEYALSPQGRSHLLARAQTTTMTTIGQDDLLKMVIPCPPLGQQSLICSRLQNVRLALRDLNRRTNIAREAASAIINKNLIGG